MAAGQVDAGRVAVFLRCVVVAEDGRGDDTVLVLHAETVPGAAAKDLHKLVMWVGGVLVHVLRNVDKQVAAALHDVAVGIAGIALSCAVDTVHAVVGATLQDGGQRGTEVDEGVALTGLGVAGLGCAILVEIVAIVAVRIVVCTVAAAEDGIGAALCVLHVG